MNEYSVTTTNRVSNCEYIQQTKQHFLYRWNCEYLNDFKTRVKWIKDQPNITVVTIVLIKDDNLSIAQWAIGRVVECYSGSNGIVHTMLIKIAKTFFEIDVRKLAIYLLRIMKERRRRSITIRITASRSFNL